MPATPTHEQAGVNRRTIKDNKDDDVQAPFRRKNVAHQQQQ
jgi:hypothetical protein